MNTKKTFSQENDEILQTVLDLTFFNTFKKNPECLDRLENKLMMEVFITPDCNQSCSYCYLCKEKERLYPANLKDSNNILKNFRMLLEYYSQMKLTPIRFDLFSGEIWGEDLGNKILDILLEYVTKKKFIPKTVLVPSNFSFLLNDKKTMNIEKYLTLFEQTPTRIAFSCSNDGYYLDMITRPLNSPESFEYQKGTKEYYEKLFNFCNKWHFGYHPMVSAHGIKYWKENFKWWFDTLKEYKQNFFKSIMFLEVRNNDWTDDSIVHYLEYLNFSIDYLIKNNIFLPDGLSSLQYFDEWIHGEAKESRMGHYSPLTIYENSLCPSCTIHRTLAVRLGDLAIIPCHRTSYNEYLLGHFQVDGEKIIGIKAKNIQMMNQIWLNNNLGTAKCGSCFYNKHCTKGCYGAQLEENKDPFYPCDTVCNLYKAKNIFLYHKYKNLNLLSHPDNQEEQKFLNMIKKIKETEEYKKWTEISLQIV